MAALRDALGHSYDLYPARGWATPGDVRTIVMVLAAVLAVARPAASACLDDCRDDFGGSGADYEECVADCGVCGDGDLEGDEECDDGNTAPGDCCDPQCRPEPAGAPCGEDDDLCTTDACDGDGDCEHEEEPATWCRWPARAGAGVLVMRDGDDDARDRLVWKWRGDATTVKAEFGDPRVTTDYALCLYDDSGLIASVTVPAAACGKTPCWSEQRGGYRHREDARTPDGAGRVILRAAGPEGGARIAFDARGERLALPDLGDLEPPVTVQLRRSGSLLCWSARYDEPGSRSGRRYRARAEAPPATTTTTSTSSTSSTSASVATTSTSTTVTTGTGVPGTSTTLPGATVEVAVVDGAGAPVEDADVLIAYRSGGQASDATDATGVVVFTEQPVGVPARITAEDLDERVGELVTPGFVSGPQRVTLTVR